ncbi:MAG: ABC transporter substrate-binding protein [Candidatus Competibacteraceae bacterium]
MARAWLCLIGLLLGVWSAGLSAEPAPPTTDDRYRIFMILWRGETEVEAGFRAYVEENNLPFDLIVRNVDRDQSRIPAVIAEAKRIKPDLVYTWGTSVTLDTVGEYDKASPDRYITDLPVLFTMVSDPIGSRVVPEFASSGRNLTGTTHIAPLETQIKAIRAYRPLTRLAVLYNPAELNSRLFVRNLKILGQRMDFELLDQPVPLDAQGDPIADNLPDLIAGLALREPQFLYMGPDTFIGVHRHVITREAIRQKLPVFAATERPIRDGDALFGLVTPYYALGRFTAFKAEQILLHNKDPKTIPVETLNRFNYIVKMPVARELGIYPPMSILNYATVIE